MTQVRSSSALDRATPRRLWLWALVIALVGVALRVLWFVEYEDVLPFAWGETLTGHAWAFDPELRVPVLPEALDSYQLTRGFAPAYGAMVRGLVEAAGGSGVSAHTVSLLLLIVQTAMLFVVTLLTYALSRRVIFGWIALLPAALLTLSLALLELPGGLAPQIPLMMLLLAAVWLTTLVRETPPERRGVASVGQTILAGFLFGAAVLFNPAALLALLPVLWWSFRGFGRDYATLLLVASVLLPACWLAVAHSQLPGGLPTGELSAWSDSANEKLPETLGDVGERAAGVVGPWSVRWARGAYAAENWNWEQALPAGVREESTWRSASAGLATVLAVLYVLFLLAGLVELMAEGAGSAARLLALPVPGLLLVTLIAPGGDVLRLAVLPLMLIAITLGLVWIADRPRSERSERRARWDGDWT